MTRVGESRARDAVQALIRQHELREDFSEEVRAEVERWLEDPGLGASELADLRSLPFVTIDDASTRDLDQAIAVKVEDSGWYRVSYALADASYYCPASSALFSEAMLRGASYYLPGRSVPMLPRELSEGLVSLNPGSERRALIVEMQFRNHELAGGRIFRGLIQSEAKLSFQQVQALYDLGDKPPCSEAACTSLLALRDLGELLIAERRQRGVPQYRRTELSIKVSEDGEDFLFEGRERLSVERYNEEISLHCNTFGARWLASKDTPDDGVEPVFRVHQAPDESRIDRFARVVRAALEDRPQAESLVWRREDAEPLADYLERLPQDGELGRWARAVHRQAVMINHRSVFSADAAPHFGVGADSYARFSSPMRELVGVFVHKEAIERLAWLVGEKASKDEALREQVIERANYSKMLQKRLTRDAIGLVIDAICRRDVSESRPGRIGTVMGFTKTRLHVQLDDPPIDLKVYFRYLGDPEVELGEACLTLKRANSVKTYRLGDQITLRADSYDSSRKRWVFNIL